jgi:hypothetical protein
LQQGCCRARHHAEAKGCPENCLVLLQALQTALLQAAALALGQPQLVLQQLC